MAIRTRLRIQLVGGSLPEKEGLAAALRTAANKRGGRMDFVIVPSLAEEVRERFATEDVGYFMALESEYLRFEADRDTKAKHLVFVDSIVDRFVRMQRRDVDLGLYFMPRLRAVAEEAGQVFLYGPRFDDERSLFLAKNRLPAQAWTGEGCMDEILEAVFIGLRSGDGK